MSLDFEPIRCGGGENRFRHRSRNALPPCPCLERLRDKTIRLGYLSGMTSRENITRFCDQLVHEFHPEKVILFGSHAYGQPTADSDVDVLVILPFEGKNFRKSLEILNRLNPRFPIDLLTRRPEDITRRYAEGDPLVREAIDQGTVLYECNRPGVAAQS